ncbi:C45 family autoproteolytic acyltransferase/hydolase [Alkalihalobacterium bogoriense]|uniref:C45 family autoproteolytic acyltransferase/hydolase n=1 Tax=Alkalihalobacterium bogoriense TaxID=246272 RepID=UPI000479A324|nr:C45 family peptidase [Alkalihalobacterium bogoriense]
MEPFQVDILQLRKRPYEIGVELGKCVKHKSIFNILSRMTKPEVNIQNVEQIFSTYSSHLIEELHGISESLEIPYKKTVAMFSGYDVPKFQAMGCSAYMTDSYYVRNYDFSPVLYDHVFSLLDNQQSFASAGYNLQVIGRHDGVNEHGVVIGLHFVSFQEFQIGVSAWTAVRMVLDCCKTVQEAIALLKEIPKAACYNFSIADETGQKVVVEASPSKVVVREGEGDVSLACVNHFSSKEMQDKNRNQIDSSIKREKFIEALQDTSLGQEEVVQLFKEKNSPLFFTDYDEFFGTMHTFSYHFKTRNIITCLAGSNDELSFNFHNWCRGKDLAEQCLYGDIER